MEGGTNLYSWVSKQRAGAEKLTEGRRIRLNEIGFIWDPLEDQWEEGFLSLKKFREREGHCSVPTRHMEGGTNLYSWVSKQRAGAEKLTEGRRIRLNEIGFVWSAIN